jgi:ferredoxin
MAKIINSKTGQEIEVKDGDNIKEACEKLGVPFGCQNGLCGTCMIDIDSGEENLSDLTEEEEILERNRKHRLACQCRIKKGEVGVSWKD